MSSSVAIMLLALFISALACTARPLTLTTKDSANYHFDKDPMQRSILERAKHHVKEEPTIPNEIGSIQEKFVEIDYEGPHPSPPTPHDPPLSS
ncbi:hypothetical protein RIF29_34089 [Crotalaria pallida]|uniref:Uncharacterized protein n=1 Tax=Crotalaria pallida TaxID=3830 RepID=A0AAN9EEH4_CROPI